MLKALGKIFLLFLLTYFLYSWGTSANYNNNLDRAWDIASHRNGALIVTADEKGNIWVLNPFNNYADDWL